jgi:parallel beta-helix repeat protein
MRKIVPVTVCFFTLIIFLFCIISPEPVQAQHFSISINADGSVTGTSDIQCNENVYTFTNNVNGTIIVYRDNIVIDGAGYVLQPDIDKLIGIDISERDSVTIKNLVIHGFIGRCAILIANAYKCNIQENTFQNNNIGLEMTLSSYNRISDNYFENNGVALEFYSAKPAIDNIILDNKIINNTVGLLLRDFENTELLSNLFEKNKYGLFIGEAPNTQLENNILNDNQYNFGLKTAQTIKIDTSNTVNNKPIVYWVNQHDKSVPTYAGYLALIGCSNITVANLDISANYDGVFLLSTTNSTIVNNTFSNNLVGVNLNDAYNNVITGNILIDNDNGVALQENSSNNSIYQNSVSKNKIGVYIDSSSMNTIAQNNIINNPTGVFTQKAYSNSIYHNNFINNTENWNDTALLPFTFTSISVNLWDDAQEGNYWSDYTGTDQNSDAIGDTPYVLDQNNMDHYPLMNPVNVSLCLSESKTDDVLLPTESFSITPVLFAIIIMVIITVILVACLSIYPKACKKVWTL